MDAPLIVVESIILFFSRGSCDVLPLAVGVKLAVADHIRYRDFVSAWVSYARLTNGTENGHKGKMKKRRTCLPSVDFSACACSGVNLPKLVQPSILAALSKEPLHGYALAQRLALEDTHLLAPPDHSGIYRLLRSMEKRDLLTSVLTESESGPARREYALTDGGRKCLKRWVESLSRYRDTIDSVLDLCRG